MRVMDSAHRPILFSQQISEIDRIRGIARIGIECPFDVADGAPFTASAVVPSMSSQGNKGFANDIGHEQGRTAGLAVSKCGFDGLPEIILRSHIHDCVMDKDRIEGAS